jgi:CBS domain-containing protein
MNVESILRHKGRRVITVRSDATVAHIVGVLAEHRIGAVVVSDDGNRVDGLISERDIVGALARKPAGLLDLPAAAIMTREVVTCAPEDTIDALMAEMTKRRFRHLPVVRNGQLCGMVSIGDVVKNRLEEVEWEADSLRHFIAGG